MKKRGFIKNTMIILIEFAVISYFLGIETSVLLIGIVVLYGWMGEYISLYKAKATPMEKMPEDKYAKLCRATDMLSKDVQRISDTDISQVKWRVIPTDEINAYTYGNNIGLTLGLLNVCDELTLNAVLAHELHHSLNNDAFLKRIIWANVVFGMLMISICYFGWIIVVFGIFLLISMFGKFAGTIGTLMFFGTSKILKFIKVLAQHVLFFTYETIIQWVTAKDEYRADQYVCELGYGLQLKYFLTTFKELEEADNEVCRGKLYDVHPSVRKRILRIDDFMDKSGQIVKPR